MSSEMERGLRALRPKITVTLATIVLVLLILFLDMDTGDAPLEVRGEKPKDLPNIICDNLGLFRETV